MMSCKFLNMRLYLVTGLWLYYNLFKIDWILMLAKLTSSSAWSSIYELSSNFIVSKKSRNYEAVVILYVSLPYLFIDSKINFVLLFLVNVNDPVLN